MGWLDFGEDVVVVRDDPTERDLYGRPISGGEVRETVHNVVVAPPDTSVLTQLGANATATLHFPKGYDPSTLAGAKVEVRGHSYAVIGDPVAYKEDVTPGDWCTPVHVGHARKDGDSYVL